VKGNQLCPPSAVRKVYRGVWSVNIASTSSRSVVGHALSAIATRKREIESTFRTLQFNENGQSSAIHRLRPNKHLPILVRRIRYGTGWPSQTYGISDISY